MLLGQDFARMTSRPPNPGSGSPGDDDGHKRFRHDSDCVTYAVAAMLEIAVGDNSPGLHTVLWEQRLTCTVPCTIKKIRALRRHASFVSAAAGVRDNVFYTTRFFVAWEIPSQLTGISLRVGP
jgi:hypothetical protein